MSKYLIDLLSNKIINISGILHVGAHLCQEQSDYKQMNIPDDNIFWIEGNPELFDIIKHNHKHCYNLLVSDIEEYVDLIVTNNQGQSSSILELHEHLNIYPDITELKRIRLKTTRLDTFLHSTSLSFNTLVLDIQGAELNALIGLGKYIQQIDTIVTEISIFELYKNCPLLDDMDLFMSKHGFERIELHMVKGKGWGDAIYIRQKNISIVCDTKFLSKTITLINSVNSNSSLKCIYHVLCIDNYSKYILDNLTNKKDIIKTYIYDNTIKCTFLDEYKTNNYLFFCYFLGSFFTNYLMKHLNNIDSITYIDADIFFHSDISKLFNKLNDFSVGIFRHRQHELNYTNDYSNGLFNVGVVYFKNDEIGQFILDWWIENIEYDRISKYASCGDQRYLDKFPQLCKSHIFIDGDIGHGAPWHWQLYDYKNYEKNKTIILLNGGEEQELLFTHFSQFEYDLNQNTFIHSTSHHCYYTLDDYNNNSILHNIYCNYFNKIKETHVEINSITQLNNKPSICFGMIVFESDFVLQECLEQIYDIATIIIIVQGPVSYWQSKGKTTSTDDTNNILQNFNDPLNKIIIINGLFSEKDEQCNTYMHYLNDNNIIVDYLWMIDSDELYMKNDIVNLITYMQIENATTMIMTSRTFYGGFDNYLTGFEEKYEWRRIFKYEKGLLWKTHRPPTMKYNDDDVEKKIYSKNIQCYMYHYSYVYANPVYNKINYYHDHVNKFNTIDNYFEIIYLQWIVGGDEEKKLIENKYKGVHEYMPHKRGDCYTKKFEGQHPESISNNMNKLQLKFNKQLTEHIKRYETIWNDKNVISKMLSLNIQQLNNENLIQYPSFWLDFLHNIQPFHNKNMKLYDIGCGVGSTAKLLQQHNIKISYQGYDINQLMINNAYLLNENNNDALFDVKDMYTLHDIKFTDNDILYFNGIFDIILKGYELLEYILQLNVKYIFIMRCNISNETKLHDIYQGYDKIPVFKFWFNKSKFISIINKYNYSYIITDTNSFSNIYLTKQS